MGLDLRLSGLASGFDWKPVVEQLIELERIPQKRLESEKGSNDTKISELGILKSQLETLKSASESLQNEDIYDARKVIHGEDTEDYLSATADIGTLAGEYRVSVYSLGTNSILTSESLVPDGVGKTLNTGTALKDLPLQTAITDGTFTVESQTYEITQADLADKTLQELLDEIDVDPESNGYPVTFEYDATTDRVIVDGGELNATDPTKLPILGHPNDTSNFLKVMRLLDGEVVTRTADQDNSRSFDGSQAWLRQGDSDVNTTDPAYAYGLPDSRNYTFFNDKLYQRMDDSATNPNFFDGNKLDYKTLDIVYKDGFLYECVQDLPSVAHSWEGDYYAEDETVTYDSSGNLTPDSYWELGKDLAASSNNGATDPSTGEWDPALDRDYLAGDVVYWEDDTVPIPNKYFFWAKDNSPTQGVSPPASHVDSGPTYTKYTTGAQVESPGSGGQFYNAQTVWGNIADYASSTQYLGGALVYDPADNQVYEADATKWGNVGPYAAGTKYSLDETVYDASDDVYKATIAWSNITDHATGTLYDNGDQVYFGVFNDIYEFNFTPKTDSSVPFFWNDIVFNGGKYYQALTDAPSTPWDVDYLYGGGELVFQGGDVYEALPQAPPSKLPDPTVDGAQWQLTTPQVEDLAGAYWSEITLAVEDIATGGFWSSVDATTANVDLWVAEDTSLAGAYWANANSNVTDLSNTTYWSEYAHLSGINSYDAAYWELIKPTSEDGFWSEMGTLGVDVGAVTASDPDGIPGTGDEDAMEYTDDRYWQQFTIPDPPVSGANTYWEEMMETYIRSSQALGAVDISATILTANLNGTLGAVDGSFFLGHGAGAVEITYNIETDTMEDLITRVNASDAKVTMSYDAIGDHFILQSDLTGNLGITLNESATWDSANAGTGNLLELMGLVADATTAAADSSEMAGVGRAKAENLGENAIITMNGGERIFSQSNQFSEDAHGIAGLTLDVSKVTSDEVTFVVAKDISKAQTEVNKFIEEFNDAQKYVNSLVAVTRDGDTVTAGRFSGSLEISRLGSALRKIVFGGNYPHSASESTSDGTDKTVGDLDSRNLLSFDADNDGYRIFVEDPAAGPAGGYSGTTNYQEWSWAGSSGDWVDFTPTYSSFRVNDVGLDFRSGSDEIYLKDSALLVQELTDNPNKVKALFAEEKPDAAELDHNTGQNRDYGGLSYFLSEYIENFVESDAGTYLTHVESLRSQNKRIDTNIEDLERYLVQREESLSQSFIRMEEMQSRMSTQLQLLQNSFSKK